MLLIIDDELAKDLKILGSFPLEVIQEFCKVSGESIFKGTNPKMLGSAASKLGTTAEDIEAVVEGLGRLFVEASKLQLQSSDLKLSLKVLNLQEETEDEVANKYQELLPEIKELLKMNFPPRRNYKDLEWRLDVKLATRSLHQQIEPKYLLKLHTFAQKADDPLGVSGHEATLLEADPSNLKHLTRSLEEALREVDEQAHCRRILRNF